MLSSLLGQLTKIHTMTPTAKVAPLRIDGAMGEGGGQVLRTSLALSIITGRPIEVRRIRANRKKTGLLRQHLTAALAAAEISGGTLDGAELRSKTLNFSPGSVRSGAYRFAIGTAGSTTLVLQTVLPPLLLAEGPSKIVLEGGTHNPSAPPYDFLARALLPLIERMGPRVSARLEAHGFYPAGGGRLVVDIEPADRLEPIELHERGKLVERSVTAQVAYLPDHISDRMLARFQKRSGWPDRQLNHQTIESSRSPGAVLIAELQHEGLTEIFTAFGQPGVRSEAVAETLFKVVRSYRKHEAPVGEYLADQLIVPLALAGGGGFTTHGLSMHAKTQLELVELFLGAKARVEETDAGQRLHFRST